MRFFRTGLQSQKSVLFWRFFVARFNRALGLQKSLNHSNFGGNLLNEIDSRLFESSPRTHFHNC